VLGSDLGAEPGAQAWIQKNKAQGFIFSQMIECQRFLFKSNAS